MGIDHGSGRNGRPERDDLFQKVVELTGLPTDQISYELQAVLEKTGSSSSAMTLEDLRKAVLCYMMEVVGGGFDDSARPPFAQ